MPAQRHFFDRIEMSLFAKETSYSGSVGGWTSTQACLMQDYDEASSHILWDDTVIGNEDLYHGKELLSQQEIARHSTALTYTELRVKPNTLAGLIGLSQTPTVVSVQDAALVAYRHQIQTASGVTLPSISVQVQSEGGTIYRPKGFKTQSWTLSNNGPYWQFATTLQGSGERGTGSSSPNPVAESWLRWGDTKFWVRVLSAGQVLTLPAPPVQDGSNNLGAGQVNLSTRVLGCTVTWDNNIAADLGYRPSTGLLRGLSHPSRRSGTVQLVIEVDSATEATELNYYLNQSRLSFEVNIDSGVIIAATGAFKYGVVLVVPAMQVRQVTRGQTNEFDHLTLDCNIMSDGTNPEMNVWVYNAKAAYLV